jgi:DNA-directed RNA polymerase specialized sigma24 family protein
MAGKSNRVLVVSPEGLELLTAAKARLGLSFATIAERAGVSTGTVQRLFHPERRANA